jgi:hypothetical protein
MAIMDNLVERRLRLIEIRARAIKPYHARIGICGYPRQWLFDFMSD